MTLFLAIALGLLFGFALNRAGATNPQNIINMLRLTDLGLMKAILVAIGLASFVLFAGLELGLIDNAHVSIKESYIGVLVGGALLGIGFAIAGYCPGTGLAGAATGRKDALIFAIGGLVGALVFTLAYAWIEAQTPLLNAVFGGKVSLAQTGNESYAALLPGTNGALIGCGIAIIFMAVAWFLPPCLFGKTDDK